MSSSKLFNPIMVGESPLQHRIVLAPCTRLRATRKSHVPIVPLMETYYAQRASRPGTLLITEATFIKDLATGMDNVPGIWNETQADAWKKITDAVHAKGSFIYLQIWALGRAARAHIIREDGLEQVGPSAIAIAENYGTPRELTIEEIKAYIQWFSQAARNAVENAGFDGVEIHGANGYLIDQFMQDVSNTRTDEYGGSIDARSKFALEIVDAVVKEVGEERTGVRLSPWSEYQKMKMADPIPQFSHFVSRLAESHPNLAYLHVVESAYANESIDFLRNIWKPRPFISCGGYTADTAAERANNDGDLVAFGHYFLSNPDLPTRIFEGIPFSAYDTSTFYGLRGDEEGTEKGYIDYPTAEELRSIV